MKNLVVLSFALLVLSTLTACGASSSPSEDVSNDAKNESVVQPEAGTETLPSDEGPSAPEASEGWTMEQKNAMKSAKSYLDYSGFSHTGLVEQLEYEQYPHDVAVWAADNCGADWDAEALESAIGYIDYSGFSYSGLIDQLTYEGFTPEQAQYGADNCKADWNAEAAESAKSYLDYSAFSRAELIDQLLYEGFTAEQAEYGVTAAGY